MNIKRFLIVSSIVAASIIQAAACSGVDANNLVLNPSLKDCPSNQVRGWCAVDIFTAATNDNQFYAKGNYGVCKMAVTACLPPIPNDIMNILTRGKLRTIISAWIGMQKLWQKTLGEWENTGGVWVRVNDTDGCVIATPPTYSPKSDPFVNRKTYYAVNSEENIDATFTDAPAKHHPRDETCAGCAVSNCMTEEQNCVDSNSATCLNWIACISAGGTPDSCTVLPLDARTVSLKLCVTGACNIQCASMDSFGTCDMGIVNTIPPNTGTGGSSSCGDTGSACVSDSECCNGGCTLNACN